MESLICWILREADYAYFSFGQWEMEPGVLAAAECSGVTVPLTGHDEWPPMKDEAWSVLGGGGMAGAQPDDRLPPES